MGLIPAWLIPKAVEMVPGDLLPLRVALRESDHPKSVGTNLAFLIIVTSTKLFFLAFKIESFNREFELFI